MTPAITPIEWIRKFGPVSHAADCPADAVYTKDRGACTCGRTEARAILAAADAPAAPVVALPPARPIRVELTESVIVSDGVFVFVPAGSLGTVDDVTEETVVEVTFDRAILAGDGDGTREAQYTIDVKPGQLRAVNR